MSEAHDLALAAGGVGRKPESLRADWEALAAETLRAATLEKPEDRYMPGAAGRAHTEHLAMCSPRCSPAARLSGASW